MLLKILIVLVLVGIIGSVPVPKIDPGSADNPFKNTIDVYTGSEKISTAHNVNAPPSPSKGSHHNNFNRHSKHHGHLHNLNMDYDMQGDQPMNDDGFKRISVMPFQEDIRMQTTTEKPMATADPAVLKRRFEIKDSYRDHFKQIVLTSVGHPDYNKTMSDSTQNPPTDEQDLTYSIKPYFAECGIPKRVKDNWKDDNKLNMYFNISHGKNITMASAVIRLHKRSTAIPTHSTGSSDGDKVRVTVNYYIKETNTIKTYISDSKVVTLSEISWVEFDIKPALEAWKTHNLGLSVTVEGIDQVPLKASNFFAGSTCADSPGSATTPKPVPNIDELIAKQDVTGIERLFQGRGLGVRSSNHLTTITLPTIKICTVHMHGHPVPPGTAVNCTAQKLYHHTVPFQSRMSTGLPSVLSTMPRHVRHQKHHGKVMQMSLQSTIQNRTILCPAKRCDPQTYLDKLNSTIMR